MFYESALYPAEGYKRDYPVESWRRGYPAVSWSRLGNRPALREPGASTCGDPKCCWGSEEMFCLEKGTLAVALKEQEDCHFKREAT